MTSSLAVASGAVLTFDGSYTHDFQPGSALTGAGTVNFNNGTITIAGTFSGNRALNFSGAAVTISGSYTVTGPITVSGGNARGGVGGGLVADGSDLSIRNCLFRRNMAGFGGGVGAGPSGTFTVEDCSFLENRSDVRGGGLDAQFITALEVNRCRFEANYAQIGGGRAICLDCSWVGCSDCEFRDNASAPAGVGVAGGLLVGLVEGSTVVNCVF
ncbi:MAG: hypothetical protein GY778_16560, partial [bacterium]|nr:hypothetical protein [bacterium]